MGKVKMWCVLFIVSLFSVGFFSCSDDDENGAIVGTWAYSGEEIGIKTNNPELDNALVEEFKSHNETDESLVVEFNSDGTYVANDSEGKHPGTYSISGSEITLYDEEGPEMLHFTISNNQLRLIVDCREMLIQLLGYMGIENPDSIVIEKADITTVFTKR